MGCSSSRTCPAWIIFHRVQAFRNRLLQHRSLCSPRVAGESLPRHLEHLLPLLLHWPWCLQSCFSHIFSLLCPAAKCCYAGFFRLLKYIIPEVLPLSLMGSALASGRANLEPSGTGSMGPGGSFWQLLARDTPVALMLPKPCHANPVTQYDSRINNMLSLHKYHHVSPRKEDIMPKFWG